MIVGVVDEAVEFLLAKRGLDLAVVGAGSEGEAGDLHARFAEGDGVGSCFGGGTGCGLQRDCADAGERSGGEGTFEEFATGERAHGRPPVAGDGLPAVCKNRSTIMDSDAPRRARAAQERIVK